MFYILEHIKQFGHPTLQVQRKNSDERNKQTCIGR